MPNDRLLTLTTADAEVDVAPWRGGLVTRFDVGGRPQLFLDRASFDDPSKNVRGGIPLLFPSPGKLTNDRWAWHGEEGTLPQHGFARTRAWQVVSVAAAEVELRLDWDATERGAWPWPCTVVMRYSLSGRTLRLSPTVTNLGSSTMPYGFGLHPYFLVPQPDKGRVRIPTRAHRAFDNVTKQEVALSGAIDLRAGEVDLHLVDHGSSEASLVWEENARRVHVRGSAELTRWVIWTLAGRDFVCLEPWSCPGDALNMGRDLLELAPGATASLFVDVSVE